MEQRLFTFDEEPVEPETTSFLCLRPNRSIHSMIIVWSMFHQVSKHREYVANSGETSRSIADLGCDILFQRDAVSGNRRCVWTGLNGSARRRRVPFGGRNFRNLYTGISPFEIVQQISVRERTREKSLVYDGNRRGKFMLIWRLVDNYWSFLKIILCRNCFCAAKVFVLQEKYHSLKKVEKYTYLRWNSAF